MHADRDVEYPPEPWHLHGSAHGSLWRVPEESVPALAGPINPVTFRGTAFAVTAFIDYDERSPFPYREFLVALLVRRGPRLGLTITDIWVDNHSSLAGGRDLWAIPKEHATFATNGPRTTVSAEHEPIAEMTCMGPANHRFPLLLMTSVWQSLGSGLARAPVRVAGRIGPVTATWHTPWHDRLAWLPDSPIASCELPNFTMRFGTRRTGKTGAARAA